MSEQVLNNIKTRRVVREMTDQAVEPAQIETLLEAARWAPSGGNLRPHRLVVIQNPETRRLIRMVSPGMFQRAPVLILICINWDIAAEHNLPPTDRSVYGCRRRRPNDDAGSPCDWLVIWAGYVI